MTGVTILGRALEQPRCSVTFGAERIEVRACQQKGRVIVVEGRRFPTGGPGFDDRQRKR
jgi:hypothetical protein